MWLSAQFAVRLARRPPVGGRIKAAMADRGLIDASDSVLCVIDAQPGFVERLPDEDRKGLVCRIAWLCALASELNVPTIATEEEAERHGTTVEVIARRLPPGTRVFPKPIFGVAAVPEILDTLETTGRTTFVLTGLETDVCVSHSALGLLGRGHRVAVVRDAVASPGESHRQGLDRMRDAGAVIVGTKGLYYEWVRDVASASRMSRALSHVERPEDLLL
jgi:nicotinamidase-related amidase